MGDFRHITNPAKVFARLGQSFSGTHTTSTLASLNNRVERIPDVRSSDGKYIFSDGVGRISLEASQTIVLLSSFFVMQILITPMMDTSTHSNEEVR